MKFTEIKKRKSAVIIGIVLIGAAIIVVGLLIFRQNNSTKVQNTPPRESSSLTVGGEPVPAESQAEARRLGYYCPSWDAKPGQVAPDICLKLDK